MKITRASSADEAVAPEVDVAQPARQLATPFGVDETSELVLDLLGHTSLVAPDSLALVRGRAAEGAPVTQALIDEAGRGDLVLPESVDGARISVRVPASISVGFGTCPKPTRMTILSTSPRRHFPRRLPGSRAMAIIPNRPHRRRRRSRTHLRRRTTTARSRALQRSFMFPAWETRRRFGAR